jgi:hypothetical protein
MSLYVYTHIQQPHYYFRRTPDHNQFLLEHRCAVL